MRPKDGRRLSKSKPTQHLAWRFRIAVMPTPFSIGVSHPFSMLPTEIEAFWQIANIAAIYNGKQFGCPRCESDDHYFLKNRLRFRCKACACQFTPKSIGIFKGSKLSYSTILQMLDYVITHPPRSKPVDWPLLKIFGLFLFALRFAFVRRARRTRPKEAAKPVVFRQGGE